MSLETIGSSAIQAAHAFDARMEKLNEMLEAERVYTNAKIAEGQKQVAEETENKVREELDTIKEDLVLLDAEDQAEFKQLVKDEINFEAEQRGFVLPEEKADDLYGQWLASDEDISLDDFIENWFNNTDNTKDLEKVKK